MLNSYCNELDTRAGKVLKSRPSGKGQHFPRGPCPGSGSPSALTHTVCCGQSSWSMQVTASASSHIGTE